MLETPNTPHLTCLLVEANFGLYLFALNKHTYSMISVTWGKA